MKFFLFAIVAAATVSCDKEPSYFCSKSGVEYIRTGDGIAVHENVLGINIKCEPTNEK
jgi:hypothetical protein